MQLLTDMYTYCNIILSLTLASIAVAQNGNLSHCLKTVYTTNAAKVYPVNLDGDDKDELLILNDGNYSGSISLISQDGRYLMQTRLGDGVSYGGYPCEEITDRDGKRRLFVSYRRGDSLFMLSLNKKKDWRESIFLQERKRLEKPFEGWSGEFSPCLLHDVNKDGHEDLIGIWISGSGKYPRGVAAYDLRQGRELWYYRMGPQTYPWNLHLVDISGDGHKEIIFGTYAPANGAAFNGSDDRHSYIFVLGHDGRLIWRRQYGGVFSGVYVIKPIKYLDKVAFACYTSNQNSANPDQDSLMLVDAKNGDVLKRVKCGRQFLHPRVSDINNTGQESFIIGNTDGTVRVFSMDLEKENEYVYEDDIPITVCGVADYDNDGYQEIFAKTGDGHLIVVNHKMQLLCKQPIEENFGHETKPVRCKGKNRFLYVSVRGPTDQIWQLWELRRKSSFSRPASVGYPIMAALLAAALGFVAWQSYRCRQLAVFKEAINRMDDSGLIIAGKDGKMLFVNNMAKKALTMQGKNITGKNIKEFFPKALEAGDDIVLRLPGIKDSTARARCVKTDNGLLIILTDEARNNQCKRISAWAPVAQEMAHGIKTPLTTILLAAQKISTLCAKYEDGQKVLNYSESIEDEVKRLQKVTDGFMRFVQREEIKKHKVNPAAFISNFIETKRALIKDNAVLSIKTDDLLPNILLDSRQMETAIGNILDNAMEAVSHGGRIEAIVKKTERVREGRINEFVEIAITDNGPGIKAAYQSQLFKPFASFRPGGTGLGLLLAKKIIEDHGGCIRLDSKEDHGTTVTIVLPIGDENEG